MKSSRGAADNNGSRSVTDDPRVLLSRLEAMMVELTEEEVVAKTLSDVCTHLKPMPNLPR